MREQIFDYRKKLLHKIPVIKQIYLERDAASLERDALCLEKDALLHQVHQLTQSLLEHSVVFDETVYQNLNSMYDKEYMERNELSERYYTGGSEEYFSCTLLQKAVNIDLDGLALCCYAHSGNRGCVRIGKFRGNRFPIDLLLAARLKITRDINQGIDTPCTGCDQLQKRKWGKYSYPIENITINDWTECNLRCEYCYTLDSSSQRFTGVKRTHSLPLLFEDMFTQGYIGPHASVSWGGGEVTLYEDFEVVSQVLIDREIPQVVNTNAVLFSPVIEKGLLTKTITVQVSVDAGTKEIYRSIKGRDAFDTVWENIGKYAKAGDVFIKYIIYNKNSGIEGIKKFIELCKQKHVALVVLSPEATQHKQKAITDETLKSAAIMAYEANKVGLQFYMCPFHQEFQVKINAYLQQLENI